MLLQEEGQEARRGHGWNFRLVRVGLLSLLSTI